MLHTDNPIIKHKAYHSGCPVSAAASRPLAALVARAGHARGAPSDRPRPSVCSPVAVPTSGRIFSADAAASDGPAPSR